MKKRIISTIVLSLVVFVLQAQTHNVFHLGHSLASPYMPSMLQSFGDSTAGINHSYEIGIINGAPLFWHWDNSNTCQGYQGSTIDSKVELAGGSYDVFIMIEGSTWDNIIPDFYNYADSFHSLALSANANIQTYLYEGWNCLDTGTLLGCPDDYSDSLLWVPRVRQDIKTWEGVMDSLNALHPTANPVYIIPVAQALANLSDSIDSNVVPGLTNFRNDLFTDDIHPNDLGFYFVALVHFATIYKQSPVGLPVRTYGEWGTTFTEPSQSMALKMQEIAWETVCSYSRSGVNCSPTSLDNNIIETGIKVFPNPSDGQVFFYSKESIDLIHVYDLSGRKIKSLMPNSNRVDLTLENGFYVTEILCGTKKITKQIIIK